MAKHTDAFNLSVCFSAQTCNAYHHDNITSAALFSWKMEIAIKMRTFQNENVGYLDSIQEEVCHQANGRIESKKVN